MKIQEKPKFDTPFEWIGGETQVKALVDRFYDLMDLERGFTALRAVHGNDLQGSRDKLFWFLCGWLGGPQHYTDRLATRCYARAICTQKSAFSREISG